MFDQRVADLGFLEHGMAELIGVKHNGAAPRERGPDGALAARHATDEANDLHESFANGPHGIADASFRSVDTIARRPIGPHLYIHAQRHGKLHDARHLFANHRRERLDLLGRRLEQ